MNQTQRIGFVHIMKHLAGGDTEQANAAFWRMASRCTDDECVAVMRAVGREF